MSEFVLDNEPAFGVGVAPVEIRRHGDDPVDNAEGDGTVDFRCSDDPHRAEPGKLRR